MIDYPEIFLRLGSAVAAGCAIGLDRNLHGKPTGVKTMGLVALGAALTTMSTVSTTLAHGTYDPSAVSRTIQGVITGIGFLGAGVIVHGSQPTDKVDKVHGLTTAASIWVTAAIGVVCGVGDWRLAGIALVIVFLLFIVGGPLERKMHHRWLHKPSTEKDEISKPQE